MAELRDMLERAKGCNDKIDYQALTKPRFQSQLRQREERSKPRPRKASKASNYLVVPRSLAERAERIAKQLRRSVGPHQFGTKK